MSDSHEDERVNICIILMKRDQTQNELEGMEHLDGLKKRVPRSTWGIHLRRRSLPSVCITYTKTNTCER